MWTLTSLLLLSPLASFLPFIFHCEVSYGCDRGWNLPYLKQKHPTQAPLTRVCSTGGRQRVQFGSVYHSGLLFSQVHNSHWFVSWYCAVPKAVWGISPRSFILCLLTPSLAQVIWGRLQREKTATHLRWARCCLFHYTWPQCTVEEAFHTDSTYIYLSKHSP